MKRWVRLPLYVQIFIGILAGITLGLSLGPRAAFLKPFGEIFIRLLMMLIVPLTFFTLVSGLTKLEDLRSFRSLGGLIITYYLASSLLASGLGVAVALAFKPGKGAAGTLLTGASVEPQPFSFSETLVSWFPRNPVEAMSQGNMLQVILFSIVIGLGLLAMEKRAGRLVQFFNDAADLMITVTEFVMKTAPYGIAALVANMVSSLGSKMLAEVGRFIVADYTGLSILLIFFYPSILHFLGRLNPLRFYRHVSPAMLVAASTTSSGATLPVSMAVARENLRIPEKVWGFTLPLGATVNMNGMAVAIGVISVFASYLYDAPITPARLLQFVFLGLVLSVGTAGVKGGGIVMSGVLLQSLGLPLTLIPILASVWPILDIGHTTCNVTGDLVGTALVAPRFT